MGTAVMHDDLGGSRAPPARTSLSTRAGGDGEDLGAVIDDVIERRFDAIGLRNVARVIALYGFCGLNHGGLLVLA